MSKTAALIIKRLGEQADNPTLDLATRDLLRDARAQLIRVAPDLRAVGEEISDSAWMPDEASAEMAIAAALTHSEVTGAASFCLPIPGTTPRLAEQYLKGIHVEDHPISYNSFEGEIPKGHYGAGTVIIWDRGTWTPVGDPGEGLAQGKLVFHMHGEKLAGLWELVRISKLGEKKQDQWILFKKRGDPTEIRLKRPVRFRGAALQRERSVISPTQTDFSRPGAVFEKFADQRTFNHWCGTAWAVVTAPPAPSQPRQRAARWTLHKSR